MIIFVYTIHYYDYILLIQYTTGVYFVYTIQYLDYILFILYTTRIIFYLYYTLLGLYFIYTIHYLHLKVHNRDKKKHE